MGMIPANVRPDIDALRADLAAETLRNIVKDGWSLLDMSAGVADAFSDQTGLTALGGATYDATSKLLHNAGGVSLVPYNAGTVVGNMSNSEAAFDGTTYTVGTSSASANNLGSGQFYYVGKDWGVGVTKVITAFKAWSPSNYAFQGSGVSATIKLRGSNNGGETWVDLYTGATPTGVAGLVNITSGIDTTTAYRLHTVSLTSDGANYFYLTEVEFYTSLLPVDVATRSISFVPTAPATLVRLVALWEPLDACILGTDCLMKASTNGGGGYVELALSDLGKFDSTTRIIGGVAAVAAGSAIRWGWDTANNKYQRLRGVWAQWR